MKWIAHTVFIVVILVTVGCASRLEVRIDNKAQTTVIIAEDYSFKSKDMTAVPSRWFNANSLTGLVSAFFQNLAPLVTRPNLEPVHNPVPPMPTVTPPEPPCPVEPVTPTPIPVPPAPTPQPPASVEPTTSLAPAFTIAGNLITLDLDTLPRSMGQAGFQGSDNALYYALAYIYAYGPGSQMPDDETESLKYLQPKRQEIWNWFDAQVLGVVQLMKLNPALALICVTNDAKDRVGFRLGPAIQERVLDAGISASRVQVGQTLSPDDY